MLFVCPVYEKSLEWLNTILGDAKFFDRFSKKHGLADCSDNLKQLINQYKSFKNKPFTELSPSDVDILKRMNRLMIEKVYPVLTPNNTAKTERNNQDYVFPDTNGKKIVSISSAFGRAV